MNKKHSFHSNGRREEWTRSLKRHYETQLMILESENKYMKAVIKDIIKLWGKTSKDDVLDKLEKLIGVKETTKERIERRVKETKTKVFKGLDKKGNLIWEDK